MSARVASIALALAALALARSSRAQEDDEPPPQPPDPVSASEYREYRVVYGKLPPEEPRRTFSSKLWVGPSYQHFLDLGTYGVDAGAALGARKGSLSGYADLETVLGRTDHGLSTYQAWVGASLEGTIDRLRLGIGAHGGFLGIKRATTGNLMAAAGAGPFLFASFDVLPYGEAHALYVGLRLEATWIDAGGWPTPPWLFGPSATLGWRY